VKAAHVVSRIADYRPSPYVDDLWRAFVSTLDLDPALKAALTDPAQVDDAIPRLDPRWPSWRGRTRTRRSRPTCVAAA
jgi:hypothetical protein